MTEQVEDLFLTEARAEYQSQESLNRELSFKAGAMASLGMAALGSLISVSLKMPDPILDMILTPLAISVFATIVFAALIVRPSAWRRPHHLSDIEATMYDYEPAGIELSIGQAYRQAVVLNKSILAPKATWLQLMSIATIFSALVSVTALVHLLWPSLISGAIHFVSR